MSVSSKRVCIGRVERVKDVYGVVTHVAKELEEKEEEYVQQGGESVGEEKEETGQMKILGWNCRGMLSPTAVRELLELQHRTKADLIFSLSRT